MTRDELLAKIDERTTYLGNSDGLYFALRAVVELHKPEEITPPWEYKKYIACSVCESWTTDGAYYLEYPCPTIQAIEKELVGGSKP